MLALGGIVVLHRSMQLQLLQHYWLGHRFGLLWYWMFACFWDCIQVLYFGLFCWLWWYSISSKVFLHTVVDIMVIWVKFTRSSPFLEKAMAPHSSILAWKIPWVEQPGGLQSTGSLRVGHNWAISLSLFTFIHWRRKWQPTPVFLPGESQGWGNLVSCHLWGRSESDTTEVT